MTGSGKWVLEPTSTGPVGGAKSRQDFCPIDENVHHFMFERKPVGAEMKIQLILLVFGLLGIFVESAEWHSVFLDKLSQDSYSQKSQMEKWRKWINDGHMEMLCINTTEHKAATGRVLKASETLKQNPLRKNVGDKFLGQAMVDQRCELHFPPSTEKTLMDIFELLWGFTKMNFFPFDPVNGYKHITVLVVIKFKQSSDHTFRLRIDSKNGQVLYSNMHKDPRYLDLGNIKGCFCNMDRAINQVCFQVITLSNHPSK